MACFLAMVCYIQEHKKGNQNLEQPPRRNLRAPLTYCGDDRQRVEERPGERPLLASPFLAVIPLLHRQDEILLEPPHFRLHQVGPVVLVQHVQLVRDLPQPLHRLLPQGPDLRRLLHFEGGLEGPERERSGHAVADHQGAESDVREQEGGEASAASPASSWRGRRLGLRGFLPLRGLGLLLAGLLVGEHRVQGHLQDAGRGGQGVGPRRQGGVRTPALALVVGHAGHRSLITWWGLVKGDAGGTCFGSKYVK